jgi:hypothetical protein
MSLNLLLSSISGCLISTTVISLVTSYFYSIPPEPVPEAQQLLEI